MKYIIITTCTNRKRFEPYHLMCASDLKKGTQEDVQKNWINRVNNSPKCYSASSLYCGRGFGEVKRISESHKVDLYIISAGYGLVRSQDKLSSYNITISGNNKENIINKIKDNNFDYNMWWKAINQNESKLSTLIRNKSDYNFVLCISTPYWKLIEKDLKQLSNFDNVRVVGVPVDKLPYWGRSIALPYDDRFDGPNSPLPGTRSDFPQRACVHYLKEVLPNSSMNTDIEIVREFMTKLKFPSKIDRKRVDDNELFDLIESRVRQGYLSSAFILRWLRDEVLVSCEQSRCSRIYKLVQQRIANEF